MNREVTYANGAVEKTSDTTMRRCGCIMSVIEVRGLENDYTVRGIGELLVQPRHWYSPMRSSSTGKRIREMLFNKFIDFVRGGQ